MNTIRAYKNPSYISDKYVDKVHAKQGRGSSHYIRFKHIINETIGGSKDFERILNTFFQS